ncbi:CLUMA_CG007413, isoform A [Clunio marinus]|uniref:CLUMA_CG007413, isoform A n=1 Tax=Clunio marinus TaxID=568069 RepID=A0A1J1I4R4_9DIPT|nr:CLUMA_CG007413, isoform A [Clunio marinus]
MTFKSFSVKHQQSLLLIIFFTMSFVGVKPYRDGEKHHKHHNSLSDNNSFETMNNTRVIAQIGGSAILPCVVDASSPATVTWIRRRDYRLLTVGLTTYSSEERFHVEHARHKGVWDLRIKSVQKSDKGIYECNLSHHPPKSIFIEVFVVEAFAEITGTPDVHIDEGSTLRLECRIVKATEKPAYVFWYHEDKMVNFNLQDGYSVITIPKLSTFAHNHHPDDDDDDVDDDNDITHHIFPLLLDSHNSIESGLQVEHETPTAISVLLVQEVQFKHAGNYTCAPSNTRPTNINVHVLRGKYTFLSLSRHQNILTLVPVIKMLIVSKRYHDVVFVVDLNSQHDYISTRYIDV